uniref:Uncharacterized protein n=1 Tax=Romanomermis culicivorax TaxID=13658 RepID=A0A915HU90_ROMCU
MNQECVQIEKSVHRQNHSGEAFTDFKTAGEKAKFRLIVNFKYAKSHWNLAPSGAPLAVSTRKRRMARLSGDNGATFGELYSISEPRSADD